MSQALLQNWSFVVLVYYSLALLLLAGTTPVSLYMFAQDDLGIGPYLSAAGMSPYVAE